MRDGTHYRDQLTYSTEQVEALVPTVWNDDHVFAGPVWKGSSADPQHVPPWLLGCADVDRAYFRCGLTQPERVVLELVHGQGYTPGELAEVWQEPAEKVAATAASGIRKIPTTSTGGPRMSKMKDPDKKSRKKKEKDLDLVLKRLEVREKKDEARTRKRREKRDLIMDQHTLHRSSIQTLAAERDNIFLLERADGVFRIEEAVYEKVLLLSARLQSFSDANPGAPITLRIFSPGGSVIHGLALYDLLRSLSDAGHEVTTEVRGYCGSMASVLFLAGDVRRMGAESLHHQHEPSYVTFGKLADMEDDIEFTNMLFRKIRDIYAARTKVTASGSRRPSGSPSGGCRPPRPSASASQRRWCEVRRMAERPVWWRRAEPFAARGRRDAQTGPRARHGRPGLSTAHRPSRSTVRMMPPAQPARTPPTQARMHADILTALADELEAGTPGTRSAVGIDYSQLVRVTARRAVIAAIRFRAAAFRRRYDQYVGTIEVPRSRR